MAATAFVASTHTEDQAKDIIDSVMREQTQRMKEAAIKRRDDTHEGGGKRRRV
jgi:hypothetical protein